MVLVLIASLIAACGASNTDEELVGKAWHLGAASDTAPDFVVAVPADQQPLYALTFNSDSTFSATADCNQLSGAWSTPRREGLTITPGASTMAFCGPDSYGDLFVHLLSRADTYKVENEQLTINLTRGGRLTFVLGPAAESPSAGAAASASTSAEATAKPTKEPTPKPTKEPTPKPTKEPTPKPTKEPTPKPTKEPTAAPTTAPTPGPSNGLLGKTWQLTKILLVDPDVAYDIPADRQAKFTIVFADDGTFSAQADCNTVDGSYSTVDPAASSGDLTIVPDSGSTAACPDGSIGDLFVLGLASVVSYSIESNVLTTTTDDGGELTLQ
jgi:heat shock protein HslJ